MLFFVCKLAHLLVCTSTYRCALQPAQCGGVGDGGGSVSTRVCVCVCVCVYAGVRVCMHCVQYVCAVFVVLVLYIVYSADVCAWGKQTTKVPGK